MTPEEYCYKKIAPPGSAIYYSLRKLKSSARNAVVAVLAFYKEIEEVTLDYQDLSVAQAKLNWWRDQIIKIQQGKPDHPVAILLQKCMQEQELNPFPLIEIIDGLEQNLIPQIFNTFEDIIIQIIRTAGARELYIAKMLHDNPVNAENIYQFTLVIELVYFMQHLRHYVQRGLIFFSQDEMQKFNVNEVELQQYKTTQNIANLVQYQGDKIERSYQLAKEIKQESNLKIRAEIAMAIWQAIKSENFHVLENFINITPLRCWWISWVA